MNEAERLREEYDEKLAALRETCPHDALSDWADEWWAFAHSTGWDVRSCEQCGEIRERKTSCSWCHEQFTLTVDEYAARPGFVEQTNETFGTSKCNIKGISTPCDDCLEKLQTGELDWWRQ